MPDDTTPQGNSKPEKPYPTFPLFPHASGQWAKKIRGKHRYFGSWDDWESALDRYNREKNDLYAGRTPRPSPSDGITLEQIVNGFMATKDTLLNDGEISQRTLSDYEATCQRMLTVLGWDRRVDDLRPEDFEALRIYLSSRFGLTRLGNEIQRVRSVFKHAYDHDLLDRPMRYGQAFRKPSKKAQRLLRASKGPKMFEAAEIRAILDKAGVQLKAMVLLGINCGLGNNDVATLSFSALDLDKGWHTHARPKTGVERRCPLWPETVAAIKAAIAARYKPKAPDHASLVFVTKQGQPWRRDVPDSPISRELLKVLKALKINRPGVSFYALRHTFETIGGEAKDQVALDYLMGHAPQSDDMASVYRERISDGRLKAVVDHVHDWLFPKPVTPPEPPQAPPRE